MIAKKKPILVAHRGYTQNFPENTLLALEEAINAGAKFIEVDVQLSSDEVPHLFHDRDLQRLCEQKGALHEYTASQLSEFRASDPHRFGYKFVDNPIATLFGLAGLLQRHPDVTAFVELKRSSLHHFGIKTMIDHVLPVLEQVKRQCVIISYDLESLMLVRNDYGWPVGGVVDEWRDRESQQMFDLNPQFLFCDLETLPKKGEIKFSASRIAVFECTDPQKAIELSQRGVELVETFAIGEMIQQINALMDNA
ncbi:MAG: glycerophosphodiester phosphodiesterase family protein [Gammaproteobacteria bacterium]|nr:glycerophosphodiester phosphodiesterase family protein [Gammaproteobacteria bacterium]